MADLLREEERAGQLDGDMLGELAEGIDRADDVLAGLEEARLFSGEHDAGDAVVTINAGEGGTDAQDWAEMLLRMYLRWAERRGLKTDLKEAQEGTEAGLKSVDVHGARHQRLRAPVGRARRAPPGAPVALRLGQPPPDLVRGGGGRRPWSPTPSTWRSSTRTSRSTPTAPAARAGSTSTRPTRPCASPTCPRKIVVQCQNERSQTQNRATAMALLRARLVQAELERREAEAAKDRGESQSSIGFGSQIRSYVIHPYTMVKDLRTGHETGNAQGVLDGDLDGFIRAELERRARGGGALAEVSGDAGAQE